MAEASVAYSEIRSKKRCRRPGEAKSSATMECSILENPSVCATYVFGGHQIPNNRVFLRTYLSYAFVVSPGHILVAPQRCLHEKRELTVVEANDLFKAVRMVKRKMKNLFVLSRSLLDNAVETDLPENAIKHIHVHFRSKAKGIEDSRSLLAKATKGDRKAAWSLEAVKYEADDYRKLFYDDETETLEQGPKEQETKQPTDVPQMIESPSAPTSDTDRPPAPPMDRSSPDLNTNTNTDRPSAPAPIMRPPIMRPPIVLPPNAPVDRHTTPSSNGKSSIAKTESSESSIEENEKRTCECDRCRRLQCSHCVDAENRRVPIRAEKNPRPYQYDEVQAPLRAKSDFRRVFEEQAIRHRKVIAALDEQDKREREEQWKRKVERTRWIRTVFAGAFVGAMSLGVISVVKNIR